MCPAQAMTCAQHFETRRDRMATNVVGYLRPPPEGDANPIADHGVPRRYVGSADPTPARM
jgi:hypothetical protein